MWSTRTGALAAASALALACTDPSAPRNPHTVAALSVAAGSGQQAEVATALPEPIAFLARDSAGSPVWGATIHVSTTAGGSAVSPTTAQTDRDGIARVRWTLGSVAGTQSLVARAGPSGADVTTTVTATARPGAVFSLGADITPGPVAVTVGDAAAIVFRGVDRFGNAAGRFPAGTAKFVWNVDRPEVAEVVATEETSGADPPYLLARVVGRGVGSAVAEATVTGLGAGALHFRFDLRAYAGPGRDLALAFAPAFRMPPRISVISAGGTQTDLGQGSYPAWSPDGREIAFITPFVAQVSIMSSDGSGRRALTSTFDQKWAPAWSPDGQRIAFVSGTGNAPVVYVMNRDGTGIRAIDPGPCGGQSCLGGLEHLAWSPDGALIAYSVAVAVGQNAVESPIILLARADGSGTRHFALADGTPVLGRAPAWSPDGRSLVFSSGGSLFTADLDGAGLRRITRAWESQDLDRQPTWSRDGRIAFVRFPGRSTPIDLYGVYVVNADGTELRRVWKVLTLFGQPAWRPTP